MPTMVDMATPLRSPRSVPKLLWTPSVNKSCKMDEFMVLVNDRYSLEIGNYNDLWQWSIDNISSFWALVWEYSGIIHAKPFDQVVDASKGIDEIPEWFHGARLNFAENILRHPDAAKTALIFANENWQTSGCRRVTFGDLRTQVARMSAAMKGAGIVTGDVVGIYAPNVPQSMVFALAAASIGAIITAVSPDFGHQSVLDRFQQTEPKLLLTANAVLYNGKIHGHWEKLEAVLNDCPSIAKVVWIDYIQDYDVPPPAREILVRYDEFIEDCDDAQLEFVQLPFNHPLYILYSSGTTGKPKCIVHSAGGTLIQHLKEHQLHGDLGPEDTLLQYTTVGWMMWQWMLTPLALGTTLVLYDGSPFRPKECSLLDLISSLGVTAFGTSAKYLQRLEEARVSPTDLGLDFSRLLQVFSTGSPLPASTFEYITEAFGGVRIASITGGTDIISLFAGGCPTLPVYAGLIQCRCLGMAVYAIAANSTRPDDYVYDEPGDLICARPFPSMPVFFWRDDPHSANSAYQRAYFSTLKGVWHHGDFVEIDSKTGGILMLGRSDGTLNPSGVRFGSADLYAIVSRVPKHPWGIRDSLAVGVRRIEDPDERVILFLELEPNHECTLELVKHLKELIRAELSPRHVPALILSTPQIPYTINGKKVEVAVKRILSGMPGVCISSLANPEALDYFRNLQLS